MTIERLNRTYQSDFWHGENVALTVPVFTFDSAPPGFVWTGTVSICAATAITQGTGSANPPGSDSHNDFISNMIWTLYRNGQPEMTWIGLSMAVNVQIFGNDKVVVTGRFGGGGANNPGHTSDNPLGLVCTFIGYSQDEASAQPLVPYVAGTTQASPNATMDSPNGLVSPTSLIKLGAGSYPMGPTPTGLYTAVRLWDAHIALSCVNTGSNVVYAYLKSQNGVPLVSVSVTGSGQSSLSVNPRGFLALANTISLEVVDVSGTATGITAHGGYFYSQEMII